MANPNLPEAGRATQFQPGNGGGPGRTNPAKRAAGEACWKALLADFEVCGVEAIERMRATKPEAYVALVASGLPAEKSLDVSVRKVETLSEEQSRMMAEEIIERHKRRLAGAGLAISVHDSVPAGLQASTVTQTDS